MLAAMEAELTREKQDLVINGMQRPYFIEYRLEDIHSYEAVANYGALTSESESRQRVVRVEVRVGSYVTRFEFRARERISGAGAWGR